MSAELLRRAAKVLREHAERATEGPWNASPVDSPDGIVTSAVYSFVHPTGTTDSEVIGAVRKTRGGGLRRANDARYIALMHPPVALALAELLDLKADCAGTWPGDMTVTDRAALAVARAILREDS